MLRHITYDKNARKWIWWYFRKLDRSRGLQRTVRYCTHTEVVVTLFKSNGSWTRVISSEAWSSTTAKKKKRVPLWCRCCKVWLQKVSQHFLFLLYWRPPPSPPPSPPPQIMETFICTHLKSLFPQREIHTHATLLRVFPLLSRGLWGGRSIHSPVFIPAVISVDYVAIDAVRN